MEDVDEGGFDAERVIYHVTWSPKRQTFLVAINTDTEHCHTCQSDSHETLCLLYALGNINEDRE